MKAHDKISKRIYDGWEAIEADIERLKKTIDKATLEPELFLSYRAGGFFIELGTSGELTAFIPAKEFIAEEVDCVDFPEPGSCDLLWETIHGLRGIADELEKYVVGEAAKS